MPKDLTSDIKSFLIHLRRDEGKHTRAHRIIIKTKDNSTKFKLRCSRYLYTALVNDQEKAKRIKNAIPQWVQKSELGGKKGKKTKETGKKAPTA